METLKQGDIVKDPNYGYWITLSDKYIMNTHDVYSYKIVQNGVRPLRFVGTIEDMDKICLYDLKVLSKEFLKRILKDQLKEIEKTKDILDKRLERLNSKIQEIKSQLKDL